MPVSIAIKGRDFNQYVDQGLSVSEYRHLILAEGDSWMERSSAFTASLPDYLARAMADDEVLIINLALFGDTMRRIGDTVSGEFGWWLKQFKFDAILLSAGGNDFIDAARDPHPGQGILHNMAGLPLPPSGADCADMGAIATLVGQYITPGFMQLLQAVRGSTLNAHTPIFLNEYDTPVARRAPAPPMKKAWLYEAYDKNGVDESLWPELTGRIFLSLRQMVQTWSQQPGVHVVPTLGVLTPAQPGSTGSSGDWVNEIHPNASGWEKLAERWKQSLQAVLNP